MGLPGLNVIFHLASGAIDVLVDGASAHLIEAGDDEAGIDALGLGLDAGDAFDSGPARGAIVEFFEAAQLVATRPGSARGRARFQGGDVLAQRGGGSDAE